MKIIIGYLATFILSSLLTFTVTYLALKKPKQEVKQSDDTVSIDIPLSEASDKDSSIYPQPLQSEPPEINTALPEVLSQDNSLSSQAAASDIPKANIPLVVINIQAAIQRYMETRYRLTENSSNDFLKYEQDIHFLLTEISQHINDGCEEHKQKLLAEREKIVNEINALKQDKRALDACFSRLQTAVDEACSNLKTDADKTAVQKTLRSLSNQFFDLKNTIATQK